MIDWEALVSDLKKIHEHCASNDRCAHVTLSFNPSDILAQFAFALPNEDFQHARTYQCVTDSTE